MLNGGDIKKYSVHTDQNGGQVKKYGDHTDQNGGEVKKYGVHIKKYIFFDFVTFFFDNVALSLHFVNILFNK